MAASLTGVLPTNLQEKVLNSKVLVVGAGGIGCEILKNLVLSGFPNIEIIDLDTIDVSNLNRQFLFHREHVGKSKAEVARESALQFNPNVKVKAYHDSIMTTEYGVNFYEQFNVVLNALDNRAARNHVNRMCLNANVPLIESGTAGYNGQVELIKKGLTQCYECTPKAKQRTFAGCTIRNTPSEPIHCIVWAKHLFNQLFGETTDDEDISPDMEDPEAKPDGDKSGDVASEGEDLEMVRVNTRQWAKECKYNHATLFNKFFHKDIKYLLSMSNLWQDRQKPRPIEWDNVLLQETDENISAEFLQRQYHRIWSLAECAIVFQNCIEKLRSNLESLSEGEFMVWDKDDQAAMDFVAACANIRAYIFNIGRKSRFDVKAMAGNIIPAIATTNAITAGMVVLHAFKVLQSEFEQCKSVYMRLRLNPYNQLLVPDRFLSPPNPDCTTCSADPAIHLRVDTKRMRMKQFRDEVLIKSLNMVNPDMFLGPTLIISSEEGETESNEERFLNSLGIVDGVILKCDDFFQNYVLTIVILHIDAERDAPIFEVIADKSQLQPKEEKEEAENKNGDDGENVTADGPSSSKRSTLDIVDVEDDDLILVEDDLVAVCVAEATNKMVLTSPDKPMQTGVIKRKPSTDNGVSTGVVDSDHEEDGPSHAKRVRKDKHHKVSISFIDSVNID